jgi:hypothetical protein
MADVLYYLDDYTDEAIPCEPTLDGWAKWLASDDQETPHPKPAVGEIFEASRLLVLGDVETRFVKADGWQAIGPVPEAATAFYLRHHEGSTGWDAQFSGETIADALQEFDVTTFDAVFLACVADGGERKLRFDLDDDGQPRLVDVTEDLVTQ